MNKFQLTSAAAALSLLALPAISLASTYQYVNTSGHLQSVEAANADVALATAPNIAPHSGVALFGQGELAVGGGDTYTDDNLFYQYVDTNGDIKSVNAANAQAALSAPNIAPHSGVILVTTQTQLHN